MHLLHGSCNAIGGQCFVIKNRWGEPPDGLAMANVPPTIKFALGENPKRSNFTAGQDRYPQTRAGVEQVIRDSFVRARDYRARQVEYKKHKRGLPPRTDFQLEAIAEILEGKRIIHCHSYRQDEILMLIRLAEEFGVHVGTFTHVLEGYKIADELAAHGAVGSTFSDWWAYKFEVIDAIPYNGYLMWDRGVTVCYNSDSDNLARRLNTEAAKAVKYGGVPEQEAIKFVTLNPAISLGIQDRVGSLEVGKDADFSIWDKSPLSYESHCEQTWIDGRKYFDLAADRQGRAALEADRAALVARAKRAKQGDGSLASADTKPAPRYLRDADRSGNTCGDGHDEGFVPEAVRREQEEAGQ
jgi:N-acetylglucosamine-6-phosphate deacetylase